jgi:hypothetical protein
VIDEWTAFLGADMTMPSPLQFAVVLVGGIPLLYPAFLLFAAVPVRRGRIYAPGVTQYASD